MTIFWLLPLCGMPVWGEIASLILLCLFLVAFSSRCDHVWFSLLVIFICIIISYCYFYFYQRYYWFHHLNTSGLGLDIWWHNGKRDPSIDEYLQMCAYKTGTLARMSAKIRWVWAWCVRVFMRCVRAVQMCLQDPHARPRERQDQVSLYTCLYALTNVNIWIRVHGMGLLMRFFIFNYLLIFYINFNFVFSSAVVCGGTHGQVEAFGRFAEAIGVAFQIQDGI